MTAYYFAANYGRNAEMRTYRDELIKAIPQATVTSRWIDQHGGGLLEDCTPLQLNTEPEACVQYAEADLRDLDRADVTVLFTTGMPGSKGGRHVEFGFALGCSMLRIRQRLAIVGPRENVFHTLPDIAVYPTWTAFLRAELEHAVY